MLIEQDQYNIGYICSALQCKKSFNGKISLRFIDNHFIRQDYSFKNLDDNSNKIANILNSLGVKKGERVFTYLSKCPELFFIFLGALKHQAVVGTLFANFGKEALIDRLEDSGARVIFTSKKHFKKIKSVSDSLLNLKHIILIDEDEDISEKTLSFTKLFKTAGSEYQTEKTSRNTPSVLHYTSGSTGKPKGVLHTHQSVLMQNMTGVEILKLNSDEIYWCTADPGWVTGTSYGIISPWSLGVTQIHYDGPFNPENYFKILSEEKVTVWYTAPTLIRMLMQREPEIYENYDLSNLKYIFSVGEPLNPEAIHWVKKVLNKDIYDTWFQTETGAIMIANKPGMKIKPGSMGKPVKEIEAVILNKENKPVDVNTQGKLCIKKGWDSMFVSYLNNEQTYASKFIDGYYFTHDEAKVDAEGYFWFAGRSDDIINTAGHLISPFEIESSLLEMPEIAESAAIAIPDPVLYEAIVVFVKPSQIDSDSEEIALKARLHLSNKLSTIATPKDVVIKDNIPKNKSGKIMRRLLRAEYLRLDPGDISTLEDF